jgi:hypothetical protein
MSWKDEIKKKDKPIYQQPDKMRFVGRISNPAVFKQTITYNSKRFQKLLAKGDKRRNGLRMHELEELLKWAENINNAAPKQLAWIKSELKKHE